MPARPQPIDTATSLLHLDLPKYQADDDLHGRLAKLSQHAHELAPHGKGLADTEREIDETAAEMWGVPIASLDKLARV